MNGPKHIVSRHWRLILFAAVLAGVAWLFYAMRSILFPFLIGLLVAYILLPVVNGLESKLPQRKGWPKINRYLAITVIFLLVVLAAGLFFFYILTIVYNTITSLIASSGEILSVASDTIQRWAVAVFRNIPPSLREQVNRYLAEAASDFVNAVRNFITQSLTFIPATIGFFASLITMPVFLFFVLLDWAGLRDGLYGGLSSRSAEYLRNVITITGDALREYFRGQLILAVIIGVIDFIGMSALGVGFAPALGAIAAVGEFIPWAGPVLAGAVAVLVALATAPDRVLWVIAWYVIVQFAENNLLVPRIQGGLMHIHPAIVLVVLVIGAQMAGVWGLFFALPVTASVVRVYRYFRHVSAVQDARELASATKRDLDD